jgi:hypothetical protein
MRQRGPFVSAHVLAHLRCDPCRTNDIDGLSEVKS